MVRFIPRYFTFLVTISSEIFFLISVSDVSLLVYRNAFDFLVSWEIFIKNALYQGAGSLFPLFAVPYLYWFSFLALFFNVLQNTISLFFGLFSFGDCLMINKIMFIHVVLSFKKKYLSIRK